MIGKTISHYKILEKLGEGGMGVVYKAQDIKLDRLVALKFLPPHLTSESEEKERFIHEAKAASALSHTNITTIYEIDEFEGQMFIVMEYCEGRTLKQVIEKETLPIKKVLDIGIQICEGLVMAHEKGIVHRDIKSDNIMLTPRGQVKIMDFGLAKLKGATKLTKTRSTLGTLAYMSPEQAQGEEVDSRSDIFSFGVVLYELLTKNLPFGGEHQAAVIYSIINEEPQPIARFNNQVSAKLEDIVSKALAKDREDRYQHADELLADLRRERKSLDYLKTGQIPKEVIAPKSKRRLLPFVIPASVVFILVLLFLILKPFKFEIAPEKGAVAKENSLAIMYFENLVDREDKGRLGEIVTNLLITSLSESQYMRVISSQRLYDILKLMGKEGAKIIDKNVASEVANKANAKWMVLGGIVQVEPRMVITTQLVDVKSGQVIASQRIMAQTKQDIFSLVDTLALGIKKDLSLPAQAGKEETPKVATVTTHSQEAYRYYLEGKDYNSKLYYAEAEKSYKKALEYDSTFAMAYLGLASIAYNVGDPELKELIAKAVKYSDKVSQKEKMYIQAWEAIASENRVQCIKVLQKLVERYPDEKQAFLLLGQLYRSLRKFQEAVHCLSKAIEMDSLYRGAYRILAYVYDDSGDYEKSIWAINKYIALAPGEALPYDTRGNLYAYNGKLDQAIDSYKKALEIKPDFYRSLSKLGHMYLFKRDYPKAESCYKELASCSDKRTRSEGRTYLAYIPLYQGKFNQALKILDQGIAADQMEKTEDWTLADKYWCKVAAYEALRNYPLALRELELTQEVFDRAYPDDPVGLRPYLVDILVASGNIAKAEEVARTLKKRIEEKGPALMFFYWNASGSIELAKGNKTAAVDYYKKAYKEANTTYFWLRYLLAKAYLESGNLSDAVSVLEKALLRYDDIRAGETLKGVMAYYLLGLAYDKSGWTDKAIEKYEEFLDILRNADPGIPEVADAKERLQRLKGKT
ncbi:MAG: FlgO family outer membrane protein [candidate division Zixibacteria bacterium]|nr:FlgO family outer membrane protein [candidate division Zixibacteria bacterium]